MVTARQWGRCLAVVVLVAMTGRAISALSCLVPCEASLPRASVAQTPGMHCGASHAPEGLSGSTACRMLSDTDRAALRSVDRLLLAQGTAHLLLTFHAAAPPSVVTVAQAAWLLRATHAPPGKPLPLRI